MPSLFLHLLFSFFPFCPVCLPILVLTFNAGMPSWKFDHFQFWCCVCVCVSFCIFGFGLWSFHTFTLSPGCCLCSMTFKLQGASISILVATFDGLFCIFFLLSAVPLIVLLYCSSNVLFALVVSLKFEWNNFGAGGKWFLSLKGGVSKTWCLKERENCDTARRNKEQNS